MRRLQRRAVVAGERNRFEKAAVAIAPAATVWVIGAALLLEGGDLNPAAVVPTGGCFWALWGAVRSDVKVMWLGTTFVVLSTVLYILSVGLVVAPAGLGLIVGSTLLMRSEA